MASESRKDGFALQPGTKLTTSWLEPPADLELRALLCLLLPFTLAICCCLSISYSMDFDLEDIHSDYDYSVSSMRDHIIIFYYWAIPATILFAILFHCFICTSLWKFLQARKNIPLKKNVNVNVNINVNSGVTVSRILLTLAYSCGLFSFFCLVESTYLQNHKSDIYDTFNHVYLAAQSTYLILIIILFFWGLGLLFKSNRLNSRKQRLNRGVCPRCNYDLRGSIKDTQVFHCPECNLEILLTETP